MEADERLDYAVLVSLMTREEAEVMAGALRADGIDAFLGNANHAGIDWFYIFALGGLQVMVPRPRLLEAKEAVRARVREHANDFPEERAQRRDRWKLWLVGAYMFFPFLAIASYLTIPDTSVEQKLIWAIEEVLG
jgi:hypothetical protein